MLQETFQPLIDEEANKELSLRTVIFIIVYYLDFFAFL